VVAVRYFIYLLVFAYSLNADSKPINYQLRGKEHPVTGIKFNRLGYPIFESKFNCRLPFHLIHASEGDQFRYCTNKLREYLKRNPDYKKVFTGQQLNEINKKKPRIDKFTWHHHQAKSQRLLQLVDRELHDKTAHTEGRAVFGGGKMGRLGKVSSVFPTSTVYVNPKVQSWSDYEKMAKKINKNAIAVPAVMTQDNKLIMSLKNGAYSGIAVVGIESGMAYYDFLKGYIYQNEFNQKVIESAMKGGAVGGSEALVMFLLPTPHGLVLLGAGVGAYIIVDEAIKKYHYYKEKHFLNADDLKVYGIELDSVLDIEDDGIPLNVEKW
jgi:hypothetical protein